MRTESTTPETNGGFDVFFGVIQTQQALARAACGAPWLMAHPSGEEEETLCARLLREEWQT